MRNSFNDESNVPLIVDLDGTFTKVDTFHETLLLLFFSVPKTLFVVFFSLIISISKFKSEVAKIKVFDANYFPINDKIYKFLLEEKLRGREILLVTGTNQKQADVFMKKFDFFSQAVGSTDEINLTGKRKAAYLTDRFGEIGYDYVGNSKADLYVWRHARNAYIVSASEKLHKQLKSINKNVCVLDKPRSTYPSIIKQLRVHQWTKNLLIFLPMIITNNFGSFYALCLAFVLFSLTASTTYLINDLSDLQADREHPTKKYRPLASGAISVAQILYLLVFLFTMITMLATFVDDPNLLYLLGTYFFATILYSIIFKRIALLDLFLLVMFYDFRILAGVFVGDFEISVWLFLFASFLFMSVAIQKRVIEIRAGLGVAKPMGKRPYKPAHLQYLISLAISSSTAAIIVLCLYLSEPLVLELYSNHNFIWLFCPLIYLWCLRGVFISEHGRMDDDPVIFYLTDKVTWLVFFIAIMLILMAL